MGMLMRRHRPTQELPPVGNVAMEPVTPPPVPQPVAKPEPEPIQAPEKKPFRRRSRG